MTTRLMPLSFGIALGATPALADAPCALTMAEWDKVRVADAWEDLEGTICQGITTRVFRDGHYWVVMRWPLNAEDGFAVGGAAFLEDGELSETYFDPRPDQLADGTLSDTFFGPLTPDASATQSQ